MKLHRLIPAVVLIILLLVGCGIDKTQDTSAAVDVTNQTQEPVPGRDPDTAVTPENSSEPENPPEVMPEITPPDISSEPAPTADVVTSPSVTATPEVTTTPEMTTSPEVTTTPEMTTSPEVTTTPEAAMTPEAAATPEVTTTPEATVTPEATPTPEVTPAPAPTPTPTPTPTPAASSTSSNGYLTAVASGTKVQGNDSAVIDYSNTADGYVMVQYTKATSTRLKAQVKGPKTTYTYDLTAQKWATFPLSEGSGSYSVTIYANASGTKYATVLSVSFSASIKSEFEPFLYPNQYVDYASAPNTVAKAKELTSSISQPLDKVAAVYDYVVGTLTYDRQKAETVKSGYLPVLDDVLAKKTGICFDYAALMTGMLRSQGVPCKLVVGYAGSAYHAWINVWTAESGWIDGAIFFNGKTWQRMDPTFASSGQRSDSIMEYIGDGSNYKEKYLY